MQQPDQETRVARSVRDFFPVLAGGEIGTGIGRVLRSAERKVARNQMLAMEGDQCKVVLCVRKGWLSLGKSLSGGETQIIDFALPGDVLDPPAADGVMSMMDIQAVTDASVAMIPEATWQQMIRDWPGLQGLATRIAAASRARRAERMLRLGKGSAQMRVAYALMELCIRLRAIGLADCNGFHIPLTQQQLGDFAGLSSVHVCRTLRRLNRQGIITVEDHMDIRILDVDALAAIADTDPEVLSSEIVPTAA